MAAKIFRINYKSDFVLTLNSDAGWMTPFCIKFWTGAPSQAFFVGWDGETYTHCAYDPSEPTKLLVQFDDHHLPIGDLKLQIAYHFTVADFPNDTEDEVINPANITTEIDGQEYQVMLDFTGETAPEIEFSLPAYANEAQRIANEQQRIANEEQRIADEQTRISNEETRISREQTRQDNEAQRIRNEQTRINQEEARVREFATLKHDSQEATAAANDAAALANQKAQLAADKAQLAADKAALAQDAAALANEKAQLAAAKAALANDAAALANEKAALAQQKAEYAKDQGDYAKQQGDYAKEQGDYAKQKGDDAATQMQQQAQAFSEAQAARQTAYEQAEGTESGSEAGDGSRWGAFKTNEAARDAKVDAKVADITNLQKAVAEGAVYDISANHLTEGVPTKYANLSAALGADGANVPVDKRKGGMSIKFIQSSDNKYVQYRLMHTLDNDSTAAADFVNTANWQGVDDEPTAGSKNLVESGGVSKYLTNNIITGKGDTLSQTQIHSLVSGQSYKLVLKTNVWSTEGMTQGNYLFAIQNYYNGNHTDIVHLLVSEMANLKKEYTFTVPNDSDYIRIGARYPSGQNLEFSLIPDYSDYQLKGTITTTAEVDNAKESGIYKMTGGAIILVTKYSDSNINQARISVTSEGNLAIQNRIFNGTSWSVWKTYQNEYDFKGNFSRDSDLDSIYGSDKAGIYKNDVTGFLCSIRYYLYEGGITIQTYYVTTTGGSFTIKTRRKVGSGSWSDWKNVLVDALDIFTGHYSNTSELNDIKESGCYRNEKGTIVIVTKYSENIIRQLMITCVSTGGIKIQYRDFNGTSWGNWIQYSKDIEDAVLQKALSQIISSDGLITITNDPYIAPISDPLKALSSGECNFYHEVSTGLVYVVVIEGFDHVYEASDCCSLYVFSLTNPNIVKRYQFAQKINNSKKCSPANIVPIGTKQVRVFYSIRNEDSGYCYYRDFDFNAETFTEPQKATLSITGEITAVTMDGSFSNGDVLTGNMIKTFTDDNGGTTGIESAEFVYIQKITEPMADGYRYATLCCGESISYNLVLVRSNDNFASIELVAVLPYLTRYDCAVAGINSKLYFVHRVAGNEYASTSGSALFTADITDLNNIVWSADTKFAEGDSRTDCYLYNNEIYLIAGNNHSVLHEPKRVSASVWKGTSDNPSEYTKVLVVNDSRGVQNPRVFRYGAGDYGVLMQNSPARIDYANGWTSQWQFKTATCFVHTRIN